VSHFQLQRLVLLLLALDHSVCHAVHGLLNALFTSVPLFLTLFLLFKGLKSELLEHFLIIFLLYLFLFIFLYLKQLVFFDDFLGFTYLPPSFLHLISLFPIQLGL
jgi:hypothetical protein